MLVCCRCHWSWRSFVLSRYVKVSSTSSTDIGSCCEGANATPVVFPCSVALQCRVSFGDIPCRWCVSAHRLLIFHNISKIIDPFQSSSSLKTSTPGCEARSLPKRLRVSNTQALAHMLNVLVRVSRRVKRHQKRSNSKESRHVVMYCIVQRCGKQQQTNTDTHRQTHTPTKLEYGN